MFVTINPESFVSELPVPGEVVGNVLNLQLRAQLPANCIAFDMLTSQYHHCKDMGFRIIVREGEMPYRPKNVEAIISLRDDLHLIIIRDFITGEPVEMPA